MCTRSLLAFTVTSMVTPFTVGQVPFTYEQVHSLGPTNSVGTAPGMLTRGMDDRFYGATASSDAGVGTLYRLDTNGGNPEVIHRFADDGTEFTTQQRVVYGRDSKIYGWVHPVGSSTTGSLFRMDPSGANFQAVLTSQQAQTTGWRELLDGSDARIYAIAGAKIVCTNRDGSGFAAIHTNLSGNLPDQLFEGSDGKLYVVESTGAGLIFRIDKDGTNRAVLRDFAVSPVTGAAAPRAVFEASNGMLYGSLIGIGTLGTAKPKVFEMSRDGSTFTIVRELDTVVEGGLTYGNVIDSLIEGSDGLLYGSVPNSGLQKPGYAFRMNKNGTNYGVLFEWPAAYLGFDAGANVNRSATKQIIEGADGRLHGTTIAISNAPGALYRFQRDGTGFETVFLYEKSTAQGSSPTATLAQAADGVLFGTARTAGDTNGGTVFRLDPDGSRFEVVKTFPTASQGVNPVGVIVGSDGVLYGVTEAGGTAGFGTVFKVNPDGSSFAVLRSFLSTDGDGRMPQAPLMEGTDGALYGSTTFGGGQAAGSLFKISRDGSGYAILHRFTEVVNGLNVTGRLLEGIDGVLYGTAILGGPQGGGTVFAISKTGTGFKLLHTFAGTGVTLRNPRGSLIQAPDGMLYGTATAGGASNFGGVFRVQPTGSGFQVLHEFNGSGGDGRAPEGGVTLGRDGFLYGMTRFGGGAVNGSIYRLKTDGTSYEKLRAFTGTEGDGGNPLAALLPAADGALYGTTSAGGILGLGTVFRILFDSSVPAVTIQRNSLTTITLSWSESAADFHLEADSDLANTPGWVPFPTAPVLVNGQFSVTIPISDGTAFFRLARP